VIDAWSLLRLILAVGFVALAAYATADPTSVPLAPLYIPVIATAAVIGPGETVIVLIAVAIARVAPLMGSAGEAAAVTEQGVVLGVVGIVLAVGTRRTVASLDVALDRLRTTNASARRRNRQIAWHRCGRPDAGCRRSETQLAAGRHEPPDRAVRL
jgi:hypothetical protein